MGQLPDGQATIWCKNIPEKLNPLCRVHRARTSQTTDRQTTDTQMDGFAIALAKRNVVTFQLTFG